MERPDGKSGAPARLDDPLRPRGPRGDTPLHRAARRGDLAACRALALAACLDLGNYWGETPLYLAAQAGAAEAVRFLLAEGADPCVPCHESGAPVSPAEAAASPEIRAVVSAAAAGWPFGGPEPVAVSPREAFRFRRYLRWLMALEIAYCAGRQAWPRDFPAEAEETFRAEGLAGLARRCRAFFAEARAERLARLQRLPERAECHTCGATAREGGPGADPAGPRPLRRCGRCRQALYCSPACQREAWALHRQDCAPPRGPIGEIAHLAALGQLTGPTPPPGLWPAPGDAQQKRQANGL